MWQNVRVAVVERMELITVVVVCPLRMFYYNVAGSVKCRVPCDQFFSEQLSTVALNLEGIHVVSRKLFEHVFHV